MKTHNMVGYTYKLELSERDAATITFVGGRYGWTKNLPTEAGLHELTEVEAWEWKEAATQDDTLFSMLDPMSTLFDKLLSLFDEIV